MRPHRLSILGVGLLGGSIGLAARSALGGCEIVGYAHRPATARTALEVGAVDRATADLAEAVVGADLVILCTPVSLFEPILRQLREHLAPGTLVTDVGSTKRSIVRLAARLLPTSVHFVGSHPMAGSEKRGVEFARADLFRNALCLLTPTKATDPTALQHVEAFWQTLGMRTQHLSPADHDRLLAQVSHLPHALAAALVAMQESAGLDLAGKGFLDTTRIAGGDGGLWRDIFLDNRDNLSKSLASLRKQLRAMENILKPEKADELAAWLDAAAARRKGVLQAKLNEMLPD